MKQSEYPFLPNSTSNNKLPLLSARNQKTQLGRYKTTEGGVLLGAKILFSPESNQLSAASQMHMACMRPGAWILSYYEAEGSCVRYSGDGGGADWTELRLILFPVSANLSFCSFVFGISFVPLQCVSPQLCSGMKLRLSFSNLQFLD